MFATQASQEIFSKMMQYDNGNEHYPVAKYHSIYNWCQNNRTQIFDDIDENYPGHFIDFIICIDENTNRGSGHNRIYELINDQQRMTTLSLFMATLYQQVNDCPRCLASDKNHCENDLDEVKHNFLWSLHADWSNSTLRPASAKRALKQLGPTKTFTVLSLLYTGGDK